MKFLKEIWLFSVFHMQFICALNMIIMENRGVRYQEPQMITRTFFFYHCIYFFLSKVRVYVDIKGVHMCFVENWHSPLSAKTRTICNTNRIVCRKEKIIRVTEATFGRFGKRKKRKKKRSCGTKNNVLSKVKEICDKNTSCLLDTSSPVFIKPCPGSSVCLRVTWKCQKKKGE